MKYTDRSVKILLQKCYTEIMEKLQNKYKIIVPLFGVACAAQAQQFYNNLGLYQLC